MSDFPKYIAEFGKVSEVNGCYDDREEGFLSLCLGKHRIPDSFVSGLGTPRGFKDSYDNDGTFSRQDRDFIEALRKLSGFYNSHSLRSVAP